MEIQILKHNMNTVKSFETSGRAPSYLFAFKLNPNSSKQRLESTLVHISGTHTRTHTQHDTLLPKNVALCQQKKAWMKKTGNQTWVSICYIFLQNIGFAKVLRGVKNTQVNKALRIHKLKHWGNI